MKQIEIVESRKETADYNRKLKFLKKNHYDNISAMHRTTDGNCLSRYKKDANYWLLKIKEFEAVHFQVGKIQDEIFKQFNDEETKRTEYHCEGCGEDMHLPYDDVQWKVQHLNMPCDCESGKLAKDCHPEYFNEVCASCEVQGEIDAGF
jgi:hypothetical protein